MNRRSFLRAGSAGLLIPFAPAIVRASSLMPVKPVEQPFYAYIWQPCHKPQFIIGACSWVTSSGVELFRTPDWLPEESPFVLFQGPA